MRKHFVAGTILVVCICLGVWWYNSRVATNGAGGLSQAEGQAPFRNNSLTTVTKPKLFKATRYDPDDPGQRAMWTWWTAMRKEDPDFQWKTPIEFYGQVLDQTNTPVRDALIDCSWTSLPRERNEMILTSDATGKFVLRGVRGKRLIVDISKPGYLSGSGGRGSFEFAAFFELFFYIPDSSTPVVFRLWKLGDSEPMYGWHLATDLTVDGKLQWFTLSTGRKGGSDLAVSVTRSNETAINHYDFKLTVEAPGGLIRTNDEMMFNAPASGYQPSLTIYKEFGMPEYTSDQQLQLYVKTAEGKFAAVKMHVMNHTVPSAEVRLTIYFNPSGSRNLEFDPQKLINK